MNDRAEGDAREARDREVSETLDRLSETFEGKDWLFMVHDPEADPSGVLLAHFEDKRVLASALKQLTDTVTMMAEATEGRAH